MSCLTKRSGVIRKHPSLILRTGIIGLLSAAFLHAPAGAAPAQRFEFDIKPQPTDGALFQIAETAEVQILFSPRTTATTQSSGLRGSFSVHEALTETLAGTNLGFEFKTRDFVVVKAKSNTARTASSGEDSSHEMGEKRRKGVRLAQLQETPRNSRSTGEEESGEKDEALELTSQTVTGSHLAQGDPTALVHTITAEEIARRGVSTLEDLFRTLPWSFPSITTQTNMLTGDAVEDTDKNLGALGLGLSTVNLRSLGSANTLVLVNGRRVAGRGGDEDSLTNLLNVPLSAIERVDIQLDGASAIYGADAIGGVVNFITRKRYQGISATVRRELSSTDADRSTASLQGGYAWGSGNVIATVSRATSEPIENYRIWTSNDFRDQYGPEFDLRRRNLGQPGIVCAFDGYYRYPGCDYTDPSLFELQLPAGNSGAGATEADFSGVIIPFDYVLPQNGEESDHQSLSVRVEQNLSENLQVHADTLISNLDSRQDYWTQLSNYLVPASNAYNPFGRHVVVNYFPLKEIQTGTIPSAYTESKHDQRNFNAGLQWKFGNGHQLEYGYTNSSSERASWQMRYDYYRGEFDPTQEKFYGALASSDPDVALNLFGDGTAQGSAFAELFTPAAGPEYGFSEVRAHKSLLRGQLFRIWGGPINYAVGAETRREVIYTELERYLEGGKERENVGETFLGVARPTNDLTSYFAELSLPIVGEDNARAGVRSLVLSLQARRDEYGFEGANGGIEFVAGIGTRRVYVPGPGWTDVEGYVSSRVGTPRLVEASKAATSPRVGLYYALSETIITRVAWSRSFQPPVFGDLFSPSNPFTYTYETIDPYHPDQLFDYIVVSAVSAGFNSDIDSEFSDNYSVGFEWTPRSMPGLRWSMDWSRVDFTNKIEDASSLIHFNPEIAFALPSIAIRDSFGYLKEIRFTSVNLARKISEIVDTSFEYAFETRIGSFTPGLRYTRVLEEYFQVSDETERVERAGTIAGSNRYTLVGSLNWNWDSFSADLFVHHIPSYANDRAGFCPTDEGRCPYFGAILPTLKVDAQTTVDLTLTYLLDNGLRIRVGSRNLFKETASTLWQGLPYDPTRWDARGQVLFLDMNWEL